MCWHKIGPVAGILRFKFNLHFVSYLHRDSDSCSPAWMKGEDLYRPAFDMVQRLFDEVIESKVDAQAALHWNQYYYVRYQQQLFRVSKARVFGGRISDGESIEQRF